MKVRKDKKVCILLLHNKNKSGLFEYAKIFNKGYDKSKIFFLSDLYPEDSQWKVFFLFLMFKGRIKKKIKELTNGFDIIHICDNPVYSLFIGKIINDFKTKLIYTLHDPKSHEEKKVKNILKKKLKLLIQNFTIKKFSKLHFVKVHIHKNWKFLKLENKVVIPHPVYREDLHFVKHYKTNTNKPKITIGFFGRIEYYKGIDLFLKIIEQLDKKIGNNEVKVVIVGKGEVESSIQLNNIEINWHNYYVKNNVFNELLSNCDLVLLPYRQASQSGVLMKTMSFNVPVIVSNLEEISDYVINNKTGFICELNDLDLWVDKILLLINSKNYMINMRKEIKINKLKYSPDLLAQKLYSVWDN